MLRYLGYLPSRLLDGPLAYGLQAGDFGLQPVDVSQFLHHVEVHRVKTLLQVFNLAD
jgi:hypothetical protein